MKIPGLVDLQVNGYKGVDFSAEGLSEEAFVWACRGVFATGTTALLPTLVTSPEEVYARNLPVVARAIEQPEFRGRLLGIHLEGPFISAEEGARGAHNAEWVREPDVDYLDKLLGWARGNVRMITIAADAPGAEDVARHAKAKGIVVSLGHQLAGQGHLAALVRAGATALTHLGNGVPMSIHRHDNPIWAGLANDDLFATVITDGHHVPASLLKVILRTKGPQRSIVISDSSALAGLEPGGYECMGHKVVLEQSGRLYDPATGYLAGSSATMLQCMNYLASTGFVGARQLVAMGFDNPLRLLGLSVDDVAGPSVVTLDEQTNTFRVESD